jgi:uncharacterized protein (DUF2235 family)
MPSIYDKAFISEEVDPQPKRIIICCDGTVTRLSRILANAGKDEHGKIWQQVVYYDAGVGTGAMGDYEKQKQGKL